jgi:AraC-like DNA-binding protein/quercetin dioxygenase-like cupin family protein
VSNSRHALDPSIEIRSFGVTFTRQQIVPPHAENWHQLIYAARGVMTVRTEDSAWVVPPHRAVWIPADVKYRVEMAGIVAMRTLYIRADGKKSGWVRSMANTCAVVNVTALLRELIVRTVKLSVLDSRIPEQRRLIGVLLDELNVLKAVPLQLPMPQDPRAVRFAELVGANPEEPRAVDRMLRKCGASRRTMERVFREETAMSLGQWLRRQKLLHALRQLASGESVSSVALTLGYNSASAFIAMFRRELGHTPARYFEP